MWGDMPLSEPYHQHISPHMPQQSLISTNPIIWILLTLRVRRHVYPKQLREPSRSLFICSLVCVMGNQNSEVGQEVDIRRQSQPSNCKMQRYQEIPLLVDVRKMTLRQNPIMYHRFILSKISGNFFSRIQLILIVLIDDQELSCQQIPFEAKIHTRTLRSIRHDLVRGERGMSKQLG